ELPYYLNPDGVNQGHSFSVKYDTQDRLEAGLTSLLWSYRAPERTVDNRPLWEAEAGYSIRGSDSGLMASVGVNVLSGIQLRARYRQVSLASDQSSFSVELTSGLNLQNGISASSRGIDDLQTQGGITVQAFFDHNQNGQRDEGEASYASSDLLILDYEPLSEEQIEISDNRIAAQLIPGTYRLEIDPAGLPLDWYPLTDAYAVEVIAGGYTVVSIPLVQSYTLAGVVTDAEGKPLAGARVEAVQANDSTEAFSITNAAGVYYLERLSQGSYTIQVNGELTDTVALHEQSEPYMEMNLQMPVWSAENAAPESVESSSPAGAERLNLDL
ncbi:MAG: carboxypeptidase regulatory-like domain-containing protein, partial [Leptolyngbya sp. SIO4C1]|nr:carboxypeptidase regulatory-like domain-containing protein [Leptolyngbya sp. SIO4C1]